MRYSLDSTLPINAFSPRGKGPFSRGMTLEGGGSVNPVRAVTDLGSSVADIGTKAVKAVVQPVYNATLKQIPGVDNALVNLDKSVAKAIPGGWGTVGTVAASFIPGVGQAAMVGLGALNGTGVMRKGNQFNLQGAIMGGAMAYGASELSKGFQAAAEGSANAAAKTGSDIVAEAAKSSTAPTTDAIANLNASQGWTGPAASNLGSNISQGAINSANAATTAGINAAQNISPATGLPYGSVVGDTLSGNAIPPPTVMDKFMSGNISGGVSQIGSNIAEGATNAANSVQSGFDSLTSPQTYSNLGTKASNLGSGALENMGKTYTGIENIISGTASLPSGTLMKAGIPLVIGASGLMALEEQKKYLDQQASSGSISNAEYNAAAAKIDKEIETARAAVSANPLKTSADTSNVSQDPTLYAGRSRNDTLYDKEPTGGSTLLYAAGGNVLMNPADDQTGMPTQTPMQNFERGGIMSMIGNTVPQQTFAAGGIAEEHFLSGGGDGMSDSIPATINGKQEARLADGEFIVPADVVSHLGNGSSKAGAKQLYSMMDKVRQARTGTKKQGKQINPRKYLTA